MVSIRKGQGAEMRLSVNRYRHGASGESCPMPCEIKGCPFGLLQQQGQYFLCCFMDYQNTVVRGLKAVHNKWFAGHRYSAVCTDTVSYFIDSLCNLGTALPLLCVDS